MSEEELPDDTAEEEELRKRQAATKDKQGRGTREREERGQRNWVCYSRGGVGSGGRTRRSKERWRENEEKVEFDTKELVTLDEVEADKAGEEGALESQDRDGELSEGELQTFVTLDEFVEEEEEEEDLKAEETLPETSPLLQEDESVDSLNPEVKINIYTMLYFSSMGKLKVKNYKNPNKQRNTDIEDRSCLPLDFGDFR